ncbi:sulfotransferase [Elysia marginata]|uniref:Sulfotransferase n=1 Tax=Elysia marginata TaxID=1093978 RepID=A0AAV4IIV3_9GAST|nr:sulfotransferase [Elysia marginata]
MHHQQPQRNQPQQHKKQTYVMMQYTPLATGSAGQFDTYGRVHQFVPPPAIVARCPKLTRYKMLGFLAVAMLSLVLLAFTAARTSRVGDSVFRGDDHSLPNRGGAAVSPMCNLVVQDEAGAPGGAEGEVVGNAGLDGAGLQGPGGRDSIGTAPLNRGQNEVHVYPSERYETDPSRRRIKRFPTAIVIGARKAGTRAVLRFVDLHPDVVTSKREPHFFDREYNQGLEWYRHEMPLSLPSQITLEKTPNYLVDWDVPKRVYSFNESIKLILIVREPISRAVSDYVQLKERAIKNGRAQPFPDFEELAIDPSTGAVDKSYAPVKRSLYSRHLERWLAFFNLSQILVVDGDNIRYRPWEEMAKVEKFLGLSHQVKQDCFVFNETKGFFCVNIRDQKKGNGATVEKCLSESKGRVHPPIDPVVRSKLKAFYRPFNKRFFYRIGRTFPWD